ncbi:hypothetical protein ACIF8W_10390 [Streptomyces sp. NPDC085639]|uniref:hypothetical protein n=1 Tax=Streptomyces sp. NPDC085639 TaxID=3365734 RepID=UPI0037D9861C
MTFDEEWAAAKQSTTTAGGSSYDLVVTQDDLGDVGHEAFVVHGELRKKSDIAGTGATGRAAAECSARNLAMGSELSVTLSTWDSQVKTVLQMYAHISGQEVRGGQVGGGQRDRHQGLRPQRGEGGGRPPA